jgi:hypothetical protein
MEKTRHWFEKVRRAASLFVFLLMVGFVVHWIYEYDVCVRSDSTAYPQVKCLLWSVIAVYFTWLAGTLAVAMHVVMRVL